MNNIIKKITTLCSLTAITVLSVFSPISIHANNVSSLYSTATYSVDVSQELETDSKTLQDYTSFSNDDVHIGITVSDNILGENVTTLTEAEIKGTATDTLHAILAQSGEGINIKEHALTTFSAMEYPCLYVAYEGSSELDDSVYMEEYIITTISYKYTIVFSADSKELLDCDAVNQFKSSFTTKEAPLKMVDKIEDDTLTNVLIASIAIVVACFIVAIIVISKKQKKSPGHK